MRATLPWHTAILAAASLTSTGCVAAIREQRTYGPSLPAADARTETVEERRDGGSVVRASATGTTLDVSVQQVTECRKVTVADRMFREVEIHRSFVSSSPQDRDAAAGLLLLAAAGFAAYNADQLACSNDASGCKSQVSSATASVAIAAGTLSLIPFALFAYNAARVQDDRRIEPVAPQREAGSWFACERRPIGGEEVHVFLGDREARATTKADGHAAVDLSTILPAGAAAGPDAALVKHAGSPDVAVKWSGPERTAPP